MIARALLALALASTLIPAAIAQGAGDSFSLVLVGGDGRNEISIGLNGDGTEYVVRANGPIGEVERCRNASDDPNVLQCPVSDVSGFVVRAAGGSDAVTVAKAVQVSMILNGGDGTDGLTGGDGADKLLGGEGADMLVGRGGADFLYGNEGKDVLLGGEGNDVLRGGPGADDVNGGNGRNDVEE